MKNTIFEMEKKIIDIEMKANKAIAVLSDLVQDYSLKDDIATEDEARLFAYGALRISQFIGISFDYVHDIKKEISKVYDDLINLHSQNKKENVAPVDNDKGGNYKEQINAVLNNMNKAELLQVFEYALNLMMQEVEL